MRENLKFARLQRGITCQEVADMVGIGIRYYQNIENGTQTGKVTIWDKLEDIFGVHQRILRENK